MKKSYGHLLALACIIVWGGAMVSTKVLLRVMSPEALMFWKFLIGYVTLWVLYPKPFRMNSKKDELLAALCGLTGVTIYFWLQNAALLSTSASNVSIIIGTAPMFTALILWLCDRTQRLTRGFVIGFVVSMAGIVLITTNGRFQFDVGHIGDALALLASAAWGVYSICIGRLDGYPTLALLRRVFFYGLLFMTPILIGTRTKLFVSGALADGGVLHFAYIGCLAGAICYGAWSAVFRTLGAVRTNAYLYLLPVVTIICSILFLGEKITVFGAVGTLLTIAGLFLANDHKKEEAS